MNSILVVIPFCAGDAARTEQLLEWIFELAERHQRGHCLLIAAPNVHPEMREKVKIAGEVAFKTCDLESPMIPERATKPEQITMMVSEAARLVKERYRMPWLLMEPDCVPVSPDWIQSLSESYAAQPKRLMGVKIQKTEPAGMTVYAMHKIAVYSPDYVPAQVGMPGELGVINKLSTTRLIQLTTFGHGMTLDKIKPEAVLIHSDKEGNAIRLMREKNEKDYKSPPEVFRSSDGMASCVHKTLELDHSRNGSNITASSSPEKSTPVAITMPPPVIPKRRGRPPKAKNA